MQRGYERMINKQFPIFMKERQSTIFTTPLFCGFVTSTRLVSRSGGIDNNTAYGHGTKTTHWLLLKTCLKGRESVDKLEGEMSGVCERQNPVLFSFPVRFCLIMWGFGCSFLSLVMAKHHDLLYFMGQWKPPVTMIPNVSGWLWELNVPGFSFVCFIIMCPLGSGSHSLYFGLDSWTNQQYPSIHPRHTLVHTIRLRKPSRVVIVSHALTNSIPQCFKCVLL